MPRTRASAKQAGSSFERSVADCLASHLNPYVDRQPKTGAKDKGDISNVFTRAEFGGRIAVECKNEATVKLASWAGEAEQERINLAAIAGVVIHKRHGKANPLEQWVTMTVLDFIAIIKEERPA